MSDPAASPWSPFPVQDWTTLPVDPGPGWRVAPDPGGGVDPTWPAPVGPRRRWLPALTLMLVLVLLSGGVYGATSVGVGVPETSARLFLPEDGDVAYASGQTTRERATSRTQLATESARTSGVTGLLSTDTAFGTAMLSNEVVAAKDLIQLWRTTTTTLDAEVPTPQTVRLYRVDAAVELMGESTPTTGYAYHPALVELPEKVGAGDAWSSAGSAGPDVSYRTSLRAEGAAGGCVKVAGTVTYTPAGGGAGRIVNRATEWCPGRGPVGSDVSFGDIRELQTRLTTPTRSVLATADAPIAWTDPTRWRGTNYTTVADNPTFGAKPMNGSPQSLTPVATTSGLVVRAESSINDLVATHVDRGSTFVSVWRAHPGGSLLTLTAYGDVVVVTTSRRELVAYSAAGVRLWSVASTDLAPTRPVRAGPDALLLADLAGEVRLIGIADGQVRWQHAIGSDVDVPPAVGGGLAVVMDRGGTTTALDLETGQVRWTADLLGVAGAVLDGTVMILQDQTLHGLDTVSGRHRWVTPVVGTFTDIVGFAQQVVLSTQSETLGLGADGRVRLRTGAFLRLTRTRDHLVGWGPTTAQVFDADLGGVASWPLPALNLALQDRRAVAVPQGVLLFGLTWDFQGWSAGA